MGLNLRKFRDDVFSSVRDVFDANTQGDYQRRFNQSGKWQSYADQQRSQGNARPASNLLGQAFNTTAKLANTTRAGVGGAYGLGKIAKSSIFDTDQDYLNTVNDVSRTLKSDLSPNSGIASLGTVFDSPEQAAQRNPGMIASKIGSSSLGAAGELAPIPAARAFKGASALTRLGKLGAVSGGANIAADAGEQLLDKGRINPKQTLIAGATGAGLGIGFAGAGRVGTSLAQRRPNVRFLNPLDRAGERTADSSSKPLISDEINKLTKEAETKTVSSGISKEDAQLRKQYQEAYDKETNPTRKRQINEGIAKLNSDIRARIKHSPIYRDQEGSFRLPDRGERNLSDSSPNDNIPPIPENVSPKTKNLIESIRAKEAPILEKGAKPDDKSLVKGEAPKTPQVPEAEFQQAFVNSKPAAQKNIGDYQYTRPKVTAKKLSIGQKLSPDRLLRENITRPLVQKAQKELFDASISGNPLARGVGKLAQGINKEAITPPKALEARRKLFGATEYGKLKGAEIRASSKGLQDESLRRVYATLDPEQASKLGIDQPTALTPEEQVYRDMIKSVVGERTQGLSQRGIITPEQASNDNYLRRAYSVFDDAPEVKKAYDGSRKAFLGTLKGRKEGISDDLVEQAITDPGYLAGKNYAEYQQAIALHDYVAKMASEGLTSDAPRPGFRQIPKSKIFGENAGKYVPESIADDISGFQYTSGLMNSINDVLTAYDHFKPRQAKKALLTILNPGVRTGNQLTNRVIFSQLNGINPLTFNKNMVSTRAMIKNKDPIYIEAVKQGLIGTDITKADFATSIAKLTDESTGKKALGWFAKSYGEADDRARLAAFKTHLDRGYSPDEAATLTQRGFQDYKSVGFFFDLAAKTPVIGNAFVRFAGDANRILANAFIDHPVRTIGTGMVWANLVNMMSKVSDESEKDKNTREGRFGAPHIPFTDVSLTVQTPIGEVNLARFVPMYALNDVGGGDARRFLPFQGNPTDSKNFNDPLLGQVGQVLRDNDFRGKSIADPTNVIFDKQTYKDTGGQAGAKFSRESNPDKFAGIDKDVAGFLASQNIPLGREANAIYSALKGGEDIYGKERNVPQAISRGLGFKVEKFGPDQAEKQRNTNKFFEGNIARTNEFLKQNPDLKNIYYKFNNPTRDRSTNTKVSDLVTPERWKLVNAEKSGRLFNFLKQESLAQNKESKKPVDPVFQLSNPQRVREVVELRSRPTGDDIEREEILRATTGWYKPFEKSERAYYPALEKWYNSRPPGENPAKDNPRPKAYRNIPHPEQPPLYQKYLNIRYGNEDKGIPPNEAAGKAFFKANADTLKNLAGGYKKARLVEINAKRKIEGFAPISQETFNNVTFGYEDDERKVFNELKYGRGYGGYGRGGGRGQSAGSLYKYAVDLEAAGSPRKPSISVKAPSKKKVSAKKRSQPKVSLKKSLV